MYKLQLPHAKLFYIIGELYKKNAINEDEKRVLKEKAISDEPQVFQLLEKYEKNKNEDELGNNLVAYIRGSTPATTNPNTPAQVPVQQVAPMNIAPQPVASYESPSAVSAETPEEASPSKRPRKMITTKNGFVNPHVPEPDEISSPWGAFLQKKKVIISQGDGQHQDSRTIVPKNTEA